MPFKPFINLGRNKEEGKDIDYVMADTRKRLILLRQKYKLNLQRELLIARDNKGKNIRNSGNYSRIGIAYYSLNIVNAAQQRLDELMSTRELQNAMNEMGLLLGLINGMPKKVGKMDSKKVVDAMKRMSGASSGAGKDLVKVLTDLSGAGLERKDTTPVESLVSVEVIERLINGDNVEQLIQNGTGLVRDTDDAMSAVSEALGSIAAEESSGSDSVEMTMDEINEMLEGL